MTDSDDTHSHARPISVAELLAKNGTIGAPPVGGRRRRRRGNSDAVTVAELTGEIPIITETVGTTGPVPTSPHSEAAAPDLVEAPHAEEPAVEPAPEPQLSAAELDYQTHLEQRDVDPNPIGLAAQAGGAEQMSPDPVIDDDEMLDLGPDVDFKDVLDKHASDDGDGAQDTAVPSYLRSSSDTLFGGQSVADDLARRGLQPGPEDIDLGDHVSESPTKVPETAGKGGTTFVTGLWVVVQCILAVAFGAGLFIAFDQLWRWNTIVALVLSVLVILGLVVGVRVVRKTEDIGSTLIAVAVGALVTLGPLALLQSR